MPHHAQKTNSRWTTVPINKDKDEQKLGEEIANRSMGKGSILRIYVEFLLINKITKQEDEQRI